MQQKTLCVKIDQYTSQVLGVIKEKYALNDKGKALDKFALIHGDEFVEKEVKEEVIAEAISISKKHMKKGFHSINDSDLDNLFGK